MRTALWRWITGQVVQSSWHNLKTRFKQVGINNKFTMVTISQINVKRWPFLPSVCNYFQSDFLTTSNLKTHFPNCYKTHLSSICHLQIRSRSLKETFNDHKLPSPVSLRDWRHRRLSCCPTQTPCYQCCHPVLLSSIVIHSWPLKSRVNDTLRCTAPVAGHSQLLHNPAWWCGLTCAWVTVVIALCTRLSRTC